VGVNPDEAVAVGASIQASILSCSEAQRSARTENIVLVDVVSLSIGVEVDNGKFDVLIPRNTTIPYKASKEFSTFEHNQTMVDIEVYEGERPLTKYNHLLGSFQLTGITKAKKGVPTIVVTFSVDANGLLTVTASETSTKAESTLVVKNEDRLSTTQIDAMIAEAAKMEGRDRETVALHNAFTSAREDLLEVDKFVKQLGGKIPQALVHSIEQLEKARTWLDAKSSALSDAASDAAPITLADVEAPIEKMKKLTEKVIWAMKTALLDKRLKPKRDTQDKDSASGGDDDGDADRTDDDTRKTEEVPVAEPKEVKRTRNASRSKHKTTEKRSKDDNGVTKEKRERKSKKSRTESSRDLDDNPQS